MVTEYASLWDMSGGWWIAAIFGMCVAAWWGRRRLQFDLCDSVMCAGALAERAVNGLKSWYVD
jgi:hypothetical protein